MGLYGMMDSMLLCRTQGSLALVSYHLVHCFVERRRPAAQQPPLQNSCHPLHVMEARSAARVCRLHLASSLPMASRCYASLIRDDRA